VLRLEGLHLRARLHLRDPPGLHRVLVLMKYS
jgi:hypothetical protein